MPFQERLEDEVKFRFEWAYRMCAVAIGLAWTAPAGNAVPVYQVLAAGPAGYSSGATAVNDAGAVAGNYLLPDGTYRAYVWQNGQATTLAVPAGAVQSWAAAIGGSGQAGGYIETAAGAQGAVWAAFGNLPAALGAYVMGMNANGGAAGMAIAGDGSGYAFVALNGVMRSLGQPAGGDWSAAYAVNAGGAAAGTAMTAGGDFRGFVAGADGSTTVLNTLGGRNSYATAINDAGLAAGHAQTASGRTQAAIWNGATVLALGTLGGGNSFAYGLNAAGQAVGYSDLANNAGTAAFLYESGILYDLNTLVAPGSGWQLEAAYGINAAGQIVGRGVYNGQQQAFLLTPGGPAGPTAGAQAALPENGAVPEPASLWLVGGGVAAFLALRFRRRRR